MLRDLFRYIWFIAVKWLTGFWFVTAAPEIVNWFWPGWFAKSVLLLDQEVPAQYQYAFILYLAVFGLFCASFSTWRDQYRLIGIRARVRQTIYLTRLEGGTIVSIILDIINGGKRSIASDWELFVGRTRLARAFERSFQTDGEAFDPQKRPIEEGAHAYGTVSFQTRLPEPMLKNLRKKFRIKFQDAARRALLADDDRR